jgi:hypothetical protein
MSPDGDEAAEERERAMLSAWIKECRTEVIVLVEGVDPITSCSLQARHSYSVDAGDVVWQADFRPCVSRTREGRCRVDFARFHELVPVEPGDGRWPPPPASHS